MRADIDPSEKARPDVEVEKIPPGRREANVVLDPPWETSRTMKLAHRCRCV